MTERAKGTRPTTTQRRAPQKKVLNPGLPEKFQNDPDVVVVDREDLTCGEIEDIEDETGLTIASTSDLAKPQGRMTRAMGWVVRRRTDPDITFEDARRLKVFFVQRGPVPPTGESDS